MAVQWTSYTVLSAILIETSLHFSDFIIFSIKGRRRITNKFMTLCDF